MHYYLRYPVEPTLFRWAPSELPQGHLTQTTREGMQASHEIVELKRILSYRERWRREESISKLKNASEFLLANQLEF